MNALLVVDMQKALFTENSNRYDADGVIKKINQLITHARESDIPIIFVQHSSTVENELKPQSEGWQILDEIDYRCDDQTLSKECCDSFCQTELKNELDKIKAEELIICGCCTDFCIDTTIRQAASIGYKLYIPADAHTTADKPYMNAKTIIQHHNFVWSNLYSPKPIEIVSTQDILESR